MSENNDNTAWVDPDDAPDLTELDPNLEKGTWFDGERQLTPEQGKAAFRDRVTKKQVNIDA
jgi:hypothetical protein